MTDRDALLASVHAAPDDDAPRLVFADWLDDNGQPERAEFIRIQVAMRREYEAHGRTDRLERLFVRSREVFYRPWAEAVRMAFGRGVGFYSRGFPRDSSVHLTAAEAVTRLPAVSTWLMPDTMVTLFEAGGRLKEVAAVGELRFVRHLCVHPSDGDVEPVTDADVAALVSSPYLARLKSLQLFGYRLGDATARAIAGSQKLRGLESLDLNSNRIGRAGAAALAASPGLASLRELNLSNNRLGSASVKALLHSPHLKGLTSMDVSGNPYTERVRRRVEERFPAKSREEIPF